MALLTVRGRRSGLLRTVPVALAPAEDGWILVSVYGVSDWSRNLETARRATITMRGGTTSVDAVRLPPDVAAPILRDAILDAPRLVQRMTSSYFDAGPDSTIADWEEEAVRHPVFHLTESVEGPFAAA
jgi:deazaflavin-dependent oxidoreductase (nitroreductase family)